MAQLSLTTLSALARTGTVTLMIRICLVTIFWILSYNSSSAQEWTRFRGPNGSGISTTPTIPTRWTDGDFNWQVGVPGVGHSSPVIWGDRLFLTSSNDDTGVRTLRCIDTRDGKTLWTYDVLSADYTKHQLNSRASATPTVDAHHVYVCWSTNDRLVAQALTHDGHEVWTKQLGPYQALHGIAASPIVRDDLLFVANDQDKQSSVMALDAKTGSEKWSVGRNTTANYSTPCFLESDVHDLAVIFTSRDQGLTSIDVATGKIFWELPVFQSHVAVASPIVTNNFVVGVSGGVGVPEEVVTVSFNNEDPTPREVYRLEASTPFVPTPLAYRDMLFTISDEGVAVCADLASGDIHWQERLKGKFYASPVCVDGKIYCASTGNQVIVLEAARNFKILARNQLPDGCHATPAISRGTLYLRTFSSLISIGNRPRPTTRPDGAK